MLLTVILAVLHILGAVAWLGGGILFAALIGPGLGRLTPQSSGEFFLKVVPRVIRFFQGAAAFTVLFGILLLYNITNGDVGSIAPQNSGYGFDLTFGIAFAIVAFVMAEAVAAPSMSRVVRLIQGMQESGQGPPSPDLPRAIRIASGASAASVVLLLITLAFMVSAGFY
jgi:hypothetical protein